MELSNIPLATMIHNDCELLLNTPIIIDLEYYKNYEGCYCLYPFFPWLDNGYQQKQLYYTIYKNFVLQHRSILVDDTMDIPELHKYQIYNIENFLDDPQLLLLQYNITYPPISIFVVCYYLIRIDEKIYDVCFYINAQERINYTQKHSHLQHNWIIKYVKEIAYIK
tara:strand:+ start:14977 stop:15474 length:498 start_codon:yes stop_codon:yes gene_type:complete